MNNDEAKKAAGRMTYGDAFRHVCAGKRIPYKKATLTKIGELVEKQMPMAAEHHHHCPICGEGFYTPPFAKEEHKELAFYPRYCYKCGQRIAWSQEAE